MRPEYMTPLANARSQFFLATHVCLLENANSCGQNTSPPWFLVKSSIACSWTSMSQHLPTSISYTKLEIATYIHELADKLLPSTTLYYKACFWLFPLTQATAILFSSSSMLSHVILWLALAQTYHVSPWTATSLSPQWYPAPTQLALACE